MSDKSNVSSKLPSAEEVINSLAGAEIGAVRHDLEAAYISESVKHSVDAEERYAHLVGLKDHYKHKTYWSWGVLGIMFVMTLFQIVLIVLVGCGVLDYQQYKWLLPTLMLQYFGQIIGLAILIVKSLFKDTGGCAKS